MKKEKGCFFHNAWIITIFVFLLATAIGILSRFQLQAYENGIIEVYACQQDGYVQLVLDQINLQKNYATHEIISNILESLDSSSNKYWTLSEQDSLIFVRDVMETNRYRGFSTATYYDSDSAYDFLRTIQPDRVTHQIIELGTRRFIASGVKFSYQNELMQIALLTGVDAVLDQNDYLNAKVNICVLAVSELIILVLSTIGLAALSQKRLKENYELRKENTNLLASVEKFNGILEKQNLYDMRQMLFQPNVLDLFLSKLEKRDLWPLYFILISCDTNTDQQYFLRDSQVMMDQNYFRFSIQPRKLLIIGIKTSRLSNQTTLTAIQRTGIHVINTMILSKRPDEPLTDILQNFCQKGSNV